MICLLLSSRHCVLTVWGMRMGSDEMSQKLCSVTQKRSFPCRWCFIQILLCPAGVLSWADDSLEILTILAYRGCTLVLDYSSQSILSGLRIQSVSLILPLLEFATSCSFFLSSVLASPICHPYVAQVHRVLLFSCKHGSATPSFVSSLVIKLFMLRLTIPQNICSRCLGLIAFS